MGEITQNVDLKTGFYDEEDFEVIFGFDDQAAWERLHSFPNTVRLFLSSQVQTEVGIALGTNTSEEHPWKEVKKEKLERCLGLISEEELKLTEALQSLETGTSIIIEYLPDQSAENDAFLVYTDLREIKEASELIRKLELFERLKQRMLTEKRSRNAWIDAGTESEIARWKRTPKEPVLKMEVQTVLQVLGNNQKLAPRNVGDVRDGYAELTPFKWKTINMVRKITTQGTQVRAVSFGRFQQTELPFPTNAATQYRLADAAGEFDPSTILASLESPTEAITKEAKFNEIKLYENDYDNTEGPVHAHRTPEVNEVLSFMNRSLCVGRSVCAMDWHSEQSGIFVASYTFETLSDLATSLQKPSERPFGDNLNRATFEACTVLLWSFEDTLEPLLELKTIREVTSLSFCPYDANLLVGGLSNGQIVLWADLTDEIERVERAKRASSGSSEYRRQIRAIMEYPIEEKIDRSVNPAAVSSLQHSSRGAITCIKWLPRNHYCTTTGHVKPHADKEFRFMVTASLDGSVCIWDLDFATPALQKLLAVAKVNKAQQAERTMYQRVNNLFFPNFKLLCEVPIMALVIDEAIYLSTPLDECTTLTKRVQHRLEPVPMSCAMSIMLGSFTGQIVEASWEGYDFEQCTIVTDESVQVAHVRGSIHDGPILAMERNPIVQSVFLSIGGHVLAISSQDDKSSPVFWRKKSAMVTAARWSLDRVSVFFIGLSNGDFEIWDLNLRTFRASICMNLGAEALTSISQHRLASARHCLAVADHNANIRIFAIAPGFVNPLPNEEETFRGMIQRELSRKAEQIGWCKAYYKRNAAAIEAQLQAEAEARELKLQEDAERVKTDATEGKSEASVKAKKAQELDKRLPLSERLEQKYQAKHFQTLLRQLMARRNVSPERMARQMRPVVERRRYNAEKRQAIDANLALMEGDFTGVHKLLRPVEKATENRSTPDPNRSERVENLRQHIADYGRVESEAQEALRTHYLPTMESFTEVLMKSKDRRDRVSIVVGTNLHHLLGYENKRSLRRQGVAPRTLLEDLEPLGEDEDAPKDPDQAEEDDQANVNRKSVNN